MVPLFADGPERMQDPRKGPGPDPAVHAKVHANASPAASRVPADADTEEQ